MPRRPPAPRRAPGRTPLSAPSPARKVALDLLLEARNPTGGGIDAGVDEARRRGSLSGQDAALAREIACGVSRQRRWLESVLARYLQRPLPGKAFHVHEALLIGIYQALFLDRIPAHTIVDEGVKLVGAVRTEAAYRGLANAILRKVVTEPRAALLPLPDTPWIIRHSVPDWLASEGGQLLRNGELEAFFAAQNDPAPLCLRPTHLARDLADDDLEQLLRLEIAQNAHVVPELARGHYLRRSFSVRARGLAPEFLPSFRRGLFTVEDEGGQIAACLAGIQPQMSVLDLCASPGGKSAHLADLAGRQLTRLLACDVSKQKIERLHETLRRLELSELVETRLVSELSEEEDGGRFDLVFLDAPCSALGTLRRHPEIRWRRSPRDLRTLARLQLELLTRAAQYVRPGGILTYSVCTFTSVETDAVIDKFLKVQEGSFSPAPAPTGLTFDPDTLAAGEGRWRTATHRDGCDAFFVARLRSNTAPAGT